jgi:hypothetical protein
VFDADGKAQQIRGPIGLGHLPRHLPRAPAPRTCPAERWRPARRTSCRRSDGALMKTLAPTGRPGEG